MKNKTFFPKTQYAKELLESVGEFKLIKEINGEYLFADPGAIYGTNKKGDKALIKFKFCFLIAKDQMIVVSKPGSVW